MAHGKLFKSLMLLVFVSSNFCFNNNSINSSSAFAYSSYPSRVYVDKRDRPFICRDSGSLSILDNRGKPKSQCPLKTTKVECNVSGHINNAKVTQLFENPFNRTIEAVYTFPLPNDSAVNQLVMRVGKRTIKSKIMKRREAESSYLKAKKDGKTAALLEQERTNVFTQSVANIPPAGKVEIEIRYIQNLKFKDGKYSFVYPMVVGPRYIPGNSIGKIGSGWSEDTNRVKDASRITPPVVRESRRSGHNISLTVFLESAFPIREIKSKLHSISTALKDSKHATIKLERSDSIPNRDFILEWNVGTSEFQTGFVTHKIGGTGYFSFSILPPRTIDSNGIVSKEVIFVIDKSGSQEGLPLQKAKETVLYCLDRLNKSDTFQILSFSNTSQKLFSKPVQVSYRSLSSAKKFVAKLKAGGGTELRSAVEKVTKLPAPKNRLRVIALMTDGFIGNEKEVLGLLDRKIKNTRWFPFGTGNSVNRMLIGDIARHGGGIPFYVLLNSPGNEVASEFYDLISSPLFTNVRVDIKGVHTSRLLPATLNDVWKNRPVYIIGKYSGGGTASVNLSGFRSNENYQRRIRLNFPTYNRNNSILPYIWARQKVQSLTDQMKLDRSNYDLKNQITELGLSHNLLTEFTSFVAVDEKGKRYNAAQSSFAVPVEAPDGVIQKRGIASSSAPKMRRPYRSSSHRYQGHLIPGFSSVSGNGARFTFTPNRWRKGKTVVRPSSKHRVSSYGNLFYGSRNVLGKPMKKKVRTKRFRDTKIRIDSSKTSSSLPAPSGLFTPKDWESKLSEVLKTSLESFSEKELSSSVLLEIYTDRDLNVVLDNLNSLRVKTIRIDRNTQCIVVRTSYNNISTIAKWKGVSKVAEHNSNQ